MNTRTAITKLKWRHVFFVVFASISILLGCMCIRWGRRYEAIRNYESDRLIVTASKEGLYGLFIRHAPRSLRLWLTSRAAVSCPIFAVNSVFLIVKSDRETDWLLLFPELQQLSLGGEFSDSVIEVIVRLKNIDDLRIGSSLLTDRGIGQLGELPRLHQLDIESPHIDGSGLLEFRNTSLLTKIELHHCEEFRDEGLLKLARFKNLEVIWFGNGMFIDGYGLAVIRELPRLRVFMGVDERYLLPEHKPLYHGMRLPYIQK